MTCKTSAASRTLRAIGPTWSLDHDSGITPRSGTSPYVGMKPTSPHSDAGSRIEPAVSLASAAKHIPAPTAAAEPDDDPPVMCAGLTGLRADGQWPTTPLPPNATSCRLS